MKRFALRLLKVKRMSQFNNYIIIIITITIITVIITIAGSYPAWAWMPVACESCMLPGRGPCDGQIPRPEDSDRVWYV
jgi:hypothetical protein